MPTAPAHANKFVRQMQSIVRNANFKKRRYSHNNKTIFCDDLSERSTQFHSVIVNYTAVFTKRKQINHNMSVYRQTKYYY